MPQSSISLYSLCKNIKESIAEKYWESIWVIAEISDIKVNPNGHCYLELIEKNSNSDQIIARIKATIWSYTFKLLKPYFETSTGQQLTAGIKVLIRVNIEFQEVYGLSLNIKDIDPNYTLGDLAQRRQLIINQLKEEGVFEMNKQLKSPDVIQKIAIISSPTAAGYEDFVNQLDKNPFGYCFYHKLYPAIMQGEKAEESIINALEQIYQHENIFDAVAIIRGGGSTTDLLCFDSYILALNIAQFPLPVLTGIGHERDTSITDMVSHLQLKTPTAVAEYLINHNHQFSLKLEEYKEIAYSILEESLYNEKEKLRDLANSFQPRILKHLSKQNIKILRYKDLLKYTAEQTTKKNLTTIHRKAETLASLSIQKINNAHFQLQHHQKNLKRGSYHRIKDETHKILSFENQNHLNDPLVVLKKGYSITYQNGKIIKDPNNVIKGQDLTTILHQGTITSIVK
ncbi:MAG: exodeoxyribonuclease VII large subunit [Marinilabiliaceae bacterium]|nr:exodeoxyribonuclease VII large subunit [Marinilabiliaceae bacterium]